MRPLFVLLCLLPLLAQADACLVHSQGEGLDVQVCQVNRNIPASLFRDGFCQPQLQGQQVEVSFVERCPAGSIGVCEAAQAGGGPYQQDIHYYGVPSDARYLQLACQTQYQGRWRAP